MTGNSELNTEWAWTQVEAWADGSLRGAGRARMREALSEDAELRAAVTRAIAVRRAVASVRPPAPPAGLQRRLLAIPGSSPGAWRWVAAPALGAAIAIVAAVVVLRTPVSEVPRTPVSEPPAAVVSAEQAAALHEFEVAMRYLRIGAERSGDQVTDVVGSSLRDALVASRDSLRDRQSAEHNGG